MIITQNIRDIISPVYHSLFCKYIPNDVTDPMMIIDKQVNKRMQKYKLLTFELLESIELYGGRKTRFLRKVGSYENMLSDNN